MKTHSHIPHPLPYLFAVAYSFFIRHLFFLPLAVIRITFSLEILKLASMKPLTFWLRVKHSQAVGITL